MEQHEADVTIIGAGLAGLAAAADLARNGQSVQLLEARDRVGGRVWSRAVAGLDRPVELGAEWLDNEGELRKLLERTGHKLEKARGDLLRRTGTGLERDDQTNGFAPLLKRLRDLQIPDRTLSAALREIPDKNEAASRSLVEYVSGFHAADPDRMSVQWLLEVEQEHGADAAQVRAVDGAGVIAGHLLDLLSDRVQLQLDCVVKYVQWSPGRVLIEALMNGSPVRFASPRAVITLPLGVLQAGVEELGAVRFEPALIAKREALSHLAMGRVVKVALVFRSNFWSRDPILGKAHFAQDPSQAFPTWWNAGPSEAPIWNGWVGGPTAIPVLRLHGDQLRDAAVGSFARTIGRPLAALEQELVSWHHHDWSRDLFSLGAYSYVLAGGRHAHAALASPLERTLYFAGEATCGEGQNATMEGAVLSGIRAAQELITELAIDPEL